MAMRMDIYYPIKFRKQNDFQYDLFFLYFHFKNYFFLIILFILLFFTLLVNIIIIFQTFININFHHLAL